MKTFLLWAPCVLIASWATAQDEAASTVRFQSIGLETRIQRQMAIWEEVEFSYAAFKNFSDRTVWAASPDHGRGLWGCVITLATPDGKEQVWGTEHVDPAKDPPYFSEERTLSDQVEPGKARKSQTVNLRDLFGELKAGPHKVRLKIPGDRYRLEGKSGSDLDSGWLAFEIIPMTAKVQEVLNQAREALQPPAQGAAARIIPDQSSVVSQAWIVELPCSLENRLPAPLNFMREGLKVANRVERLDAALQWREHDDWCSYCGSGLVPAQVPPGKQDRIVVHLPGRRGIYRAVLPIAPARGKVYSPPIQITQKPAP